MARAHLAVTTLEEHEPNREFVGRNFNGGEVVRRWFFFSFGFLSLFSASLLWFWFWGGVRRRSRGEVGGGEGRLFAIPCCLEPSEWCADFVVFFWGGATELVLKAPSTGRWLSFRSVQMVMVHELAHCLEMNHGKGFWEVRGRFAAELRALWEAGYTGDGLWGRGRTLLSGEYHAGGRGDETVLPAQVCGGAFRSARGRKRKRGGDGGGAEGKKRETYAERERRRIGRKFGVNGVALGGDEETKVRLEKGKKAKGKPRVAGSMRGRELRAAAALARFEGKKEENEEEQVKDEEWMPSGSETESDFDDFESKGEAFDLDGSRMRDGKGRGLVKVCEDEDQDDVHVKQEIEELQGLDEVGTTSPTTAARDRITIDGAESRCTERAKTGLSRGSTLSLKDPPDRIRMEDIPQYVEKEDRPVAKNTKVVQINVRPLPHANNDTSRGTELRMANTPIPPPNETSEPPEMMCPICSMSNGPGSLLCIACSHVLDTNKMTKYWQCGSDPCRGSQYVNAADCGRCGICGARKDDDDV